MARDQPRATPPHDSVSTQQPPTPVETEDNNFSRAPPNAKPEGNNLALDTTVTLETTAGQPALPRGTASDPASGVFISKKGNKAPDGGTLTENAADDTASEAVANGAGSTTAKITAKNSDYHPNLAEKTANEDLSNAADTSNGMEANNSLPAIVSNVEADANVESADTTGTEDNGEETKKPSKISGVEIVTANAGSVAIPDVDGNVKTAEKRPGVLGTTGSLVGEDNGDSPAVESNNPTAETLPGPPDIAGTSAGVDPVDTPGAQSKKKIPKKPPGAHSTIGTRPQPSEAVGPATSSGGRKGRVGDLVVEAVMTERSYKISSSDAAKRFTLGSEKLHGDSSVTSCMANLLRAVITRGRFMVEPSQNHVVLDLHMTLMSD